MHSLKYGPGASENVGKLNCVSIMSISLISSVKKHPKGYYTEVF